VKKQFLSEKDQKDLMKSAMMQYYKDCGEYGRPSAINADFINYQSNTFFLYNKPITLPEAQALRNYFKHVKEIENKQIRRVVLDSNGMTDDVLEHVLEGLLLQGDEYDQPLCSFVYSNNSMGPKSISKLRQLLPKVTEFALNNIKETPFFTKSHLSELIKDVAETGQFMVKFKLSNINLNSDPMVKQICNVFTQ